MTTDPQEGQRACADCKFRNFDRCAASWNERCITMNPIANCSRWKPEEPKPVPPPAPPPPPAPAPAIDLSPISWFGFWIAVGVVFSSWIAKALP